VARQARGHCARRPDQSQFCRERGLPIITDELQQVLVMKRPSSPSPSRAVATKDWAFVFASALGCLLALSAVLNSATDDPAQDTAAARAGSDASYSFASVATAQGR